jgi:hypothetical protein
MTDMTNGQTDFASQSRQARSSFIAEFWFFLAHHKKWWLLPIVIILLIFGALVLLGGTGLAPFIYTIF